MNLKPLVILPCYNENLNIEKILNEILSLETGFDVLVIDDNSPDGTAQTVKSKFSSVDRVALLERPGKLGLGSAYMEGFAWAVKRGYERIFTMDADFSHQPKYLPELNKLLDDNDLAIGSRYIPGGGVDGWPINRVLLSRFGNFYARNVIGLPIKDCTAGFMGMSRSLAETFLESNIRAEGYSFLIELKNFAVSKGFSVGEYPIIFIDRAAGVSKISKSIIFEALFMALRLRFKTNSNSGRGNEAYKSIDRYAGIPAIWILSLFTKKNVPIPAAPKEILAVKLSAMGDSILLIPALRAIKKRFPDSNLTLLCTDINSTIFKNCAYVNKTIVINIKQLLLRPLSFFKIFEGVKYDIALDFDQWVRLSPLLCLLSGAKTRAGFKTENQFRHYSYTSYVEHSKTKHEVNTFLDILGAMGIKNADDKLEFRLDEQSVNKAKVVLDSIEIGDFKPFAIFHPETPAHGKQRHWPAGNYVELARQLIQKHNIKALITGTAGELASNTKLAAETGSGALVLPPLDIMTVAAVISKAKFVVCGNTGIMHLACALGVPVVALHGPTNAAKWGPKGDKCEVVSSDLKCSPCLYLGFEYKCAYNRCMKNITVSEVLKAISKVAFFS